MHDAAKGLCMLQVPDLKLGPAAGFAEDSQLFFPVAALLESPRPDHSQAALQVQPFRLSIWDVSAQLIGISLSVI